MSEVNQSLAARLQERFTGRIIPCDEYRGETTMVVPREDLLQIMTALRDEPSFAFEQMMDLCGVDYLGYGESTYAGPRFGVVYHLLSVSKNQRLRVKVLLNDEPPRVDSVVGIWSCANWYEREAFDLFGILFDGHPDLRRILTDYGFIGHPFRKDFPLIGQVEMRYDPDKRRVIYEPVSIEPRVLVPRVIRHDSRYEGDVPDLSGGDRG